MRFFVPKERANKETRVPITPKAAKQLSELGCELAAESGLGEFCHFTDEEYRAAGAEIITDRKAGLANAEVVLRINKPPVEELGGLSADCVHISFLDPFNEHRLVDRMLEFRISGISMEMIPRTTLAQKMDALSSQANLAGYAAVILAAARLDMILPMMMTPAGTLSPARVFVIGAGVAGLQAIATAKRLGARVEAFDTRPVVEEQVLSLGAKFVKVDLGETGQTDGGYAKELTDAQKDLQQQAMAKVCAKSDVVITTARLFGREAPRIITASMLQKMKPGSVVIDMAADAGGNVEHSRPDEEVEIGGVRIIGHTNLPGTVPVHASEMYAANLVAMIEDFWDEESKRIQLDPQDEIVQGCLVTHRGEIFNQMIRDLRSKKG